MKEKLFITPEYTTAKEIKELRKELHLTQKEFAELINCSKPTVERWERSEEVIRGPIVFTFENAAKISRIRTGSESSGKNMAAQNLVHVWAECMYLDRCE